MEKKKKYCAFFFKNQCKNGNNCPFLHEYPPGKELNDNYTCRFFLANKCKNQNGTCNFFHGFGKRLLHIKTIEGNKDYINNLIKMDDTKYISSDDKSFIIHFLQNDEKSETSLGKEGFKIGKMIYSSNKAIFALMKEGT
jgi:hypothetical protein